MDEQTGDQNTPDVWGRENPEEGQGQQRVSGPLSLQLLESQMAPPRMLVPVQASWPPPPPKPPRRRNRRRLLFAGGVILILLVCQPIFVLLHRPATPPTYQFVFTQPTDVQATQVFTLPTQAVTPPPLSQGMANPLVSGAFSEFLVTTNGNPNGIVLGPDGAIWFTLANSNQIGRLTPDGHFEEFSGMTYGPTDIVVGPDGKLWITQGDNNQIVRLSPDGSYQQYQAPNGPIADLAAGPDGAVWFTEPDGNRIGRFSLDGQVREFPVPTPDSRPVRITRGPDGNLWFTEYRGMRVGRITPAGVITEFPVPAGGGPDAIITGPDKLLWFI
jgi:streptogramin lyase